MRTSSQIISQTKFIKLLIDGRATRSEFWYFMLFYLIFAFVVGLIDGFIVALTGFPILSIVYLLGMIIPSLAVSIRRLHDIGKSGWWYLLALVPIISLVLIAFFVIDSKEDNIYGANPKA